MSAMAARKKPLSAEGILKDPSGGIAKIRKLGITDHAIISYVVRVLDGQSRTDALHALLQSQPSLSEEQRQFVRQVLEPFPKLPD